MPKRELSEKTKKIIAENKASQELYKKSTPLEKVLLNVEGIRKELAKIEGLDTSCMANREHCIDCALSEIIINAKKLSSQED